MEGKFASLPSQAGILFISVQPQPEEDGKSIEFFVRLGLSRQFEEGTGKALIKKILEDEIRAGLRIFSAVYRGVSGACRDYGTSTTHPTAS
jgi:hypothetical protein